MARGRYDHTMDAKGRVSIPTGFRSELRNGDNTPPVLTNLVHCPAVGIFSADRRQEVEVQLASMSKVQPEVQAVRRMLISGAVDCSIDSQGRILVPSHLREHAALKHDVVLAGLGDQIELWDREGDV